LFPPVLLFLGPITTSNDLAHSKCMLDFFFLPHDASFFNLGAPVCPPRNPPSPHGIFTVFFLQFFVRRSTPFVPEFCCSPKHYRGFSTPVLACAILFFWQLFFCVFLFLVPTLFGLAKDIFFAKPTPPPYSFLFFADPTFFFLSFWPVFADLNCPLRLCHPALSFCSFTRPTPKWCPPFSGRCFSPMVHLPPTGNLFNAKQTNTWFSKTCRKILPA